MKYAHYFPWYNQEECRRCDFVKVWYWKNLFLKDKRILEKGIASLQKEYNFGAEEAGKTACFFCCKEYVAGH